MWAVSITPNSSLPGTSLAESIVGGLMTLALIGCIAGIVLSAGSWAVGGWQGNHKLVSNGKAGVMYAILGALVVVSANAIINWATGQNLGLA
jgi:hypothetical protein